MVSGDVFGAEGSGSRFDALAPHTQAAAAGLECGHFFEFRRFGLQALEQGEGIHSPSVLRTAFDAAIIALADPVEPPRIGNWQRAEHHGIDQCEYRGGPADS